MYDLKGDLFSHFSKMWCSIRITIEPIKIAAKMETGSESKIETAGSESKIHRDEEIEIEI